MQKKSSMKKTRTNTRAELHQVAARGKTPLTTQQGVIISDDQNSLKVGLRGPLLLEDFHLREKIFHFDHERIPERVVHARGYGAHGFFENYESLSTLTMAAPFQKAGARTPLFVRFSTVAGNKGSFDLARDVRGFAVKFYTEAGNWDLVGNNIPVFFIQDPIKFPDLIHAAKAEPDREFPQAQTAHDNFWDFISLTPESMHMIMWIMSDRAIPRSFRFMEGFGVHTFRLINRENKATFVKFHWKPKLGMQSVLWDEALKINGADPDFHRRDLWNAIQSGDFPEWELGLQLFDEKQAASFDFDILDSTKLIPEEIVPIKRVGRLVLDRSVDNFFAETEQVAFCTANIIPGIDFTNDPLLQGRNFSYLDTQIKRLGGPNFSHIPINAPKCPFAHFQQDGHMAMINPKGRVNYEPNSWGDGEARESKARGFVSFKAPEEGIKERTRSLSFADHYSQASLFYLSQDAHEQDHIAQALIFELSKVETPAIRLRMVSHLPHINKDLANKVLRGLGIKEKLLILKPLVSPKKPGTMSPALSILKSNPLTFAGRKLGILVSSGTDDKILSAFKKQVLTQQATFEIIAPTIEGIISKNEKVILVNHILEGAPSALFDAVALLPSAQGLKKISHLPSLHSFLKDAFNHQKFIAYSKEAAPLMAEMGIDEKRDEGLICVGTVEKIKHFLSLCKALRHWGRII